jgi:CMP-N-acetylneuraminic acid synthetase
MFELEPVEAMDIDEELDFRIAEFLYEDIGGAT